MGGGQMAHWVLKTSETSETKARIDLNPGCKFKFVNSQETYKKKIDDFGPWRDPAGLTFTKPSRVHF